jgi:hypothetical protein
MRGPEAGASGSEVLSVAGTPFCEVKTRFRGPTSSRKLFPFRIIRGLFPRLLAAGRDDLVAFDFDLDGDRRTQSCAVNDGAAHDCVVAGGTVLGQIEHAVIARIADHGVVALKIVSAFEALQIRDVFEVASAEGLAQRESPVAAARKMNNQRGDRKSGVGVDEVKALRRPRLG